MTKLHGCYECQDGKLALSLGLTGKRVVRPLTLYTPNLNDEWMFFDLKPTKEPLAPVE